MLTATCLQALKRRLGCFRRYLTTSLTVPLLGKGEWKRKVYDVDIGKVEVVGNYRSSLGQCWIGSRHPPRFSVVIRFWFRKGVAVYHYSLQLSLMNGRFADE